MPTSARLLFLIAALVLPACGPGPALYTAEAVTPETVVDGDAREWPTTLRPVPREGGLSIGLRRDDQSLVVAVIATDERQTRRVVLGGLTVWIDPEGGTDRALGIRFPNPAEVTARDVRDVASARDSDTADTPVLRRRYQEATEEVAVTRGTVTQRTQGDGRYGGLEVASTWGRRGLVVEMRIPLSVAPGLLESAPTDALGIGVELVDGLRPPRRDSGRSGQRSDGPRPDGPPMETEARPERPDVELSTVTRWLRIDL